MFRLFECCALSFFERFVLSFSLKIERFVSDSAEIWICGLYVLTFAHSKLDEGKYNAFALAPYARYSYYENKVVRLFIDGGLGFSTQKVKGLDSVNGFEIGFKPGIAIKLNDKFSVLAKCGFLGYRDDYMDTESGYGFGFTSEDLSVGFHYEF